MGSAFSLDSAYNPVSQPVIAADGDRIIYANPAAISAFGDELCKTSPAQVFPVEILENKSSSFVCSAKVCGKSSKTTVTRHEGYSLYYIDLTSEKRGELRMTRSMLSHLRNNVTGVKIAADRCFTRLEDSVFPDEKFVSILYHYYYRLARTIIQLDSADKLERGEMAYAPEPTDLVALCAELTDTVKGLCRDKAVKIVFSTEADRLSASVDSALIELMILNLFSNSLKSTESGSTIEFGIKQSHNKIVISLDDNGQGIPEDKLSEVFSLPTDNADASRPQEGIGLGLYISHEIVRLHNGVLLFEGREGDGVHVRVLLPILDDDATVFSSPKGSYQTGISPILTELSDVLSSDCYGPKFED